MAPAAPAPVPAPSSAPTVVALLLVRLRSGAVLWGLSRLVLGVLGLRRPTGMRFARVLGSGRSGGFGVVPSLHHQGVIAFFDDEVNARRFIDESPVVRAYRRHADECLVAVLRPTSSRGSWGGTQLAASTGAAADGPVATLTRASIRPRHASTFWRHSPATEESLSAAAGCRLAVGLGEAPLLRQATFSVWDDAGAVDAYARRGAHRAAAASAWRQNWFSESMFVRMVPLVLRGSWHGRAFG